jgi:hypothetical protein
MDTLNANCCKSLSTDYCQCQTFHFERQ